LSYNFSNASTDIMFSQLPLSMIKLHTLSFITSQHHGDVEKRKRMKAKGSHRPRNKKCKKRKGMAVRLASPLFPVLQAQ